MIRAPAGRVAGPGKDAPSPAFLFAPGQFTRLQDCYNKSTIPNILQEQEQIRTFNPAPLPDIREHGQGGVP